MGILHTKQLRFTADLRKFIMTVTIFSDVFKGIGRDQ